MKHNKVSKIKAGVLAASSGGIGFRLPVTPIPGQRRVEGREEGPIDVRWESAAAVYMHTPKAFTREQMPRA